MRLVVMVPFCLLLFAGGLVRQVGAQSEGLGIRVENATCLEAVLALQKASGTPIELRPLGRSDIHDATGRRLISLDERTTFDWSGTSFADAFRQLADRYRLRPEAQRGGYSLEQIGIPPRTYGNDFTAIVKGMRIQARSISLSSSGREAQELLTLRLHGIGPNEAMAGAVMRLEDVVARDDRGAIYNAREFTKFSLSRTYPDEWVADVSFEDFRRGASRLVSLEGDVVGGRLGQLQKLIVPLPLPKEGVKRRALDGTVTFQELLPTAQNLFPGGGQTKGACLLLRFDGLDPRELSHPNGYEGSAGPILVGESGKTYALSGVRTQGVEEDAGFVWRMTCKYTVIDEPLSSIRFDFGLRDEPAPLLRFRIADIPVPSVDQGPGVVSYGAVISDAFSASSSDHAQGGGTLISPVVIAAQSAPTGQQLIGLSSAQGGESTRWYEIEVKEGVGRLESVKPGSYRVLRTFRYNENDRNKLQSWWRNQSCNVTVEAGRAIRLPALEMPLVGEMKVVPIAVRLAPKNYNMTVHLQEVMRRHYASHEFSIPPQISGRATLQITLSGNVAGVPKSPGRRIGNVMALDDRGNLLPGYGLPDVRRDPNANEHEWHNTLSVNAPHPNAKRLLWIEGDMLAHGEPSQARWEIKLPLPEGKQTQELQGMVCEIDSLASAPSPRDSKDTKYFLRGRLKAAPWSGFDEDNADSIVLVGKSGAVYRQNENFNARGGSRWEFRVLFKAPEPVVAIRFDVRVLPPLRPVASFRLTDIPLN